MRRLTTCQAHHGHFSKKRYMQSAFTLMELAIVIVIIGLIAAGALQGRALIYNAQMRSIYTDYTKYDAALNTFQLQYNALPGDFDRASQFWPSCVTVDPNNAGNSCNGNNDSFIQGGAEDKRAWQHLSLSGLIPGSFTGFVYGPSPKSTKEVIWSFIGGGSALYGSNKNVYVVGKSADVGTGTIAFSKFLTGIEASSFDKKFDDGLADKGKIYGVRAPADGTNGACTTNPSTSPSASYLNDVGINCILVFVPSVH